MTEIFLGPTSITKENVQEAFRAYFQNENLELIRADPEIIGVGQGYTSFIVRLRLSWKEQTSPTLPNSAVLKALSKDATEKLNELFKINDDEAKRQMSLMITKGHITECHFYQLFGKLTTPPVPIASPYATWLGDDAQPPMIILEDLSDRATVLGDGTASLSYAQLTNLVEALASLHAWCLTTDQPWREKFGTFNDRLALFDSFVDMMRLQIRKTQEQHPDTFGRLNEKKLMKLFAREEMTKLQEAHKQWMPDVLTHGDFWANNVMFKKLPNGGMGDDLVAIIDWQMALLGNPMVDLGRVMSLSVDDEIREAHMENIGKHYFQSLKGKLGEKMPAGLTVHDVIHLANVQTAMNCLFLVIMQESMHNLFVPPDAPDSEIKKQRLIKKAKDAFTFAARFLDITSED